MYIGLILDVISDWLSSKVLSGGLLFIKNLLLLIALLGQTQVEVIDLPCSTLMHHYDNLEAKN